MRAICLGLLIALCACGPAAAAPFGFSDPVRVGAARVAVDVAAAGPGGTGVVAWLDSAGEIHAVRMGANGVIGADRTLARGQRTARDLQAVVTDRGETVLVWSSFSRERNAVAQIAASPAGVWGKLHALGAIGSYTAAMPHLAALSGGTVAAIRRDRSSWPSRRPCATPGVHRAGCLVPDARWATMASIRRSRRRSTAAR